MFSRLRNRIAFVVCGIVSASGLATGVFASCDGHYCNMDMGGCTPLGQTFQDSCCRPSGNGSNCYTCTRQWYWCDGAAIPGSAYNCSNAGATCS